ncbi:MAG: sulfatase [Candidatus Magasanikbacteria bacterium]
MSKENKILLVMIDALRYDSLSFNGYRRRGNKTTPNIDEIAEDSTIYKHAITAGPATHYSQTALTTGKYPSNMDFAGAFTELGDKTETIAEDLKKNGYSTMAIHTAMLNRDKGFGRGFDEYHEAQFMPKIKLEKDYITCGLYNLVFGKDSRTLHKNKILKNYISENKDQPFFSYACYTNTHNPYRAPYPWNRKFEREVEEWMDEEMIDYISGPGSANKAIANYEDLSEEEIDVIRSRYDAGLAYLDHRIGEIIEHLKKEGIYDETMIIITSDHGELFGEDGLFYHALSIRQELIHVPLIVKYPGQEEGEVVEKPVSLLDLYPTILEEAGIDTGEPDFDGVSLTSENGTDIPLSELGRPKKERMQDLEEEGVKDAEKYYRGLKSAQDNEFKLVKSSRGEEKLTRLRENGEGEEEMRKKLRKEIEEKLLGFWEGDNEIEVEEEIKDELEKLGYF